MLTLADSYQIDRRESPYASFAQPEVLSSRPCVSLDLESWRVTFCTSTDRRNGLHVAQGTPRQARGLRLADIFNRVSDFADRLPPDP